MTDRPAPPIKPLPPLRVEPTAKGFRVMEGERPARTPAGAELDLPTRELAEALRTGSVGAVRRAFDSSGRLLERLAPILGEASVMGGVASISATIAAPGVIRQTGTLLRMVFGEFDGSRKIGRAHV